MRKSAENNIEDIKDDQINLHGQQESKIHYKRIDFSKLNRIIRNIDLKSTAIADYSGYQFYPILEPLNIKTNRR